MYILPYMHIFKSSPSSGVPYTHAGTHSGGKARHRHPAGRRYLASPGRVGGSSWLVHILQVRPAEEWCVWMCANTGLEVMRCWGNELGWQQGKVGHIVLLMSSASWEMNVEAQLHEALLQIRETLVGEYSETLDSLLG